MGKVNFIPGRSNQRPENWAKMEGPSAPGWYVKALSHGNNLNKFQYHTGKCALDLRSGIIFTVPLQRITR